MLLMFHFPNSMAFTNLKQVDITSVLKKIKYRIIYSDKFNINRIGIVYF